MKMKELEPAIEEFKREYNLLQKNLGGKPTKYTTPQLIRVAAGFAILYFRKKIREREEGV